MHFSLLHIPSTVAPSRPAGLTSIPDQGSSNAIRVIKYRRLGWASDVARMEEVSTFPTMISTVAPYGRALMYATLNLRVP